MQNKNLIIGLNPNSKKIRDYKERGELFLFQKEVYIGLLLGDASLQTLNF